MLATLYTLSWDFEATVNWMARGRVRKLVARLTET